MTPHDRLTATIKNRLPNLRDSEVDALVKDIEGAGLVATIQTQRDAFLAGAKWWEFHSTSGTMWQSDQKEVWAKACERYPGESSLPTPPFPKPTDQTKGERG